MTMNGDHRSHAASPLDLRTTNRERGTPGCRRGVRDAPPPTPTTPPLADVGASITPATDRHPWRLPLRKRRIRVDLDAQPQAAAVERRVPATQESAIPQSVAGQRALENRVVPVSESSRQIPVDYPVPYLNPNDLTTLYTPYPMRCLWSVPEQNYHWNHHNEHLWAGISLASHQDEDGDTALHIAVVQGQLTIACKLIDLLLLAHKSLDIYNNLRQTPLHLAVITHQANMVEVLLRKGADPTTLDRNGQTALHLCCEYNQKECMSVVLSTTTAFTCLEIRNYEGLSPLHLAVQRGHKHLARMLLDAGADINVMDIKSGQSPLMHAVESSNADMVHFLVENGCDVNSQSYSGNTALHSACGRDQVGMVWLLLKSGADSSLKNYHNDTPVMVTKNKKIADVLRGRASQHMKVQDHCAIVCDSSLTEIGSPSPNHSRGCSPTATPHTPHQSTTHSPKSSSTLVFPDI